MAMVDVRVVRVAMEHLPVCMEVAVGFLTVPVLVVFVVAVSVIVRHCIMPVLVHMSFSEVEPHSTSHQYRSGHEINSQTVAEHE
jgi:hypothetical protein